VFCVFIENAKKSAEKSIPLIGGCVYEIIDFEKAKREDHHL